MHAEADRRRVNNSAGPFKAPRTMTTTTTTATVTTVTQAPVVASYNSGLRAVARGLIKLTSGASESASRHTPVILLRVPFWVPPRASASERRVSSRAKDTEPGHRRDIFHRKSRRFSRRSRVIPYGARGEFAPRDSARTARIPARIHAHVRE